MDEAYYIDSPWTWKDRLHFKFFPSRYCQLPEAPATHLDCLIIKTIITLSWLDCFRILWSRQFTVETKTVTEHIVGASITASIAYPSLRK